MSEPVSALPGAEFDGEIRVAEAGARGMVTLRGSHDDAALRKAAEKLAGVAFPGQRQANIGADGGLVWMSPDEVMVLVPHARAEAGAAQLSAALAGVHHLAVNVSDARAVFTLHGPALREVLAKGAPVDMAPEAFGPGQVRRTRLGQVAVAFWMLDNDTAELVCFRSVAGFVFDWLRNAAAPNSLPGHF